MNIFAISDIHGYYDEMIEALDEAGFDKDNPEHWLVTCGDHFDRGRMPSKVMRYLLNLPRKVLVKGNHEQLLLDCLRRGYPEYHDMSNGTAQTILDLAEVYDFDLACDKIYSRMEYFVNQTVNYFETKNYIFVHSWIPTINKDGLPAHYTKGRSFDFNPDWRQASQREWDGAMWGNPFDMAECGLLPDKTVIFGHWHASTGWAKAEGRSEFGEDAKFEPYFGDGFIAIDACTAHTRKCNVVVLEDEFLNGGN
jgi:hypothetical protein